MLPLHVQLTQILKIYLMWIIVVLDITMLHCIRVKTFVNTIIIQLLCDQCAM